MKLIRYFTKFEWTLWLSSVCLITVSFCVFDRSNFLSLFSSLIGVTSLIFAAKGNPAGPALMLCFSALYGVISYFYAYYGEMITYLGMTAPMSFISLIVWLKHPSDGGKAEVKVNAITLKEVIFMLFLTAGVTVAFYFILSALNTANLIVSTVSVATSFAAAYLTFRRSPYFSLAYALNDLILIALWTMAANEDISYISVVICFVAFFVNDLYAFFNWLKIKKRQSNN